MPHVLSSQLCMPVGRLLRLIDTDDGLRILVRWRVLPTSEDTLEPLEKMYEDVPQLVVKLISRQSTPVDISDKARNELRL